MFASAIVELTTAQAANVLAATDANGFVQIWSTDLMAKVNTFSSIYEAGGRNLVLDPTGTELFAGRSGAKGQIASYDVVSGRLSWLAEHNYFTNMAYSPIARELTVVAAGDHLTRISSQTGQVLQVVNGISSFYEGPYGANVLRLSDRQMLLQFEGSRHKLAKSGFAILSVAFSREFVFISQARGYLSCVHCVSGVEQWNYNPGLNKHVLKVYYSVRTKFLYGIVWDYVTGTSRELIRFDSRTGQTEVICSLQSWAEAFLASKDYLATSNGKLLSVLTGSVVEELEFPRHEYPNV